MNSIHNLAPHLRQGVISAVTEVNKGLPADKQGKLLDVPRVTFNAHGSTKSWSTRYAEALTAAGWELDVAQPDFLKLTSKSLHKAMNVRAIEFEFEGFLNSQNYYPSPEAFAKLHATVLADVLRQLKRVGGGLLS